MRSARRSSLRGMIKNVLIVILILVVCFTFINLTSKNVKLTKENNTLNATINSQVDTIKKLETKNSDMSNYVIQLEEENKKLETQIKEVLGSKTLGGLFKSYTDYKCLSRNSAQWKIQEKAYTDENGLRKVGDAYLVALGSYYGTTLGTQYIVTLSNGSTFKVMLCDCKQDIHTDAKNQVCVTNNSILEFYVDTSRLHKYVKASGTISTIDFFDGEVISIIQIS